MSDDKISLIYTTISSMDEAKKLANKAVEERLAVCVNIIPYGISIYEWDGKIEQSDEVYMLLKTSIRKMSKLTEWLYNNHPYDEPAIIEIDAMASESFLNYICK